MTDKPKGGDSKAQMKLGNEYFCGKKRQRNYTLAALWYRKAAKNENGAAQFNLAVKQALILSSICKKKI